MNSAITLLTVSWATATPDPDIVERTMSLRTLAHVSSSFILVAISTLFTRAQRRTKQAHTERKATLQLHAWRTAHSLSSFLCAARKRAGAVEDSLQQTAAAVAAEGACAAGPHPNRGAGSGRFEAEFQF
jgi:hypothetical protein